MAKVSSVTPRRILEVACWAILALAPVLWLVNGPPVSTDQLVIQFTVLLLAIVGAVGLRVCNWRFRR